MAQWGRNDQAVTANNTAYVSNGAPIGTYTAVKAGGGANAHFGNSSGTRASTDKNMFNNVSPSAFLSGAAVGVFGVDTTEIAVSNGYGIAHAGWNLRRAGTGPIISGSASAAATPGYNNNDIVVIKSPVAGGNATFSITTNSVGGSVTLTLTNPGFGFNLSTIPTSNIFITAAGGGAAAGNTVVTNFTASAGGRAGRVSYETLVAMGSIGASDSKYGTAALVADASDDAILPDA